MDLKDILPIIVPGIFMQVFVQAYYIKHCWDNPALSNREKLRYILAIALFNIPAAAVYLLATSKKSALPLTGSKAIKNGSQIQQGIFVLLITAFEIFALRIVTTSQPSDRFALIVGLIGACFVSQLLHGLLSTRIPRVFFWLLPALQLVFILPVSLLDGTPAALFIVLVVIAGIINSLPLRAAKWYSLTAFIVYASALIMMELSDNDSAFTEEVISLIYMNLLIWLLVFIAFYSLKKQLLANRLLDTALQNLQSQSLQLEEMSTIAERNRIAGEIHDTVGHTLTSAIISIEAGEKLYHRDPAEALIKFDLAKQRVRQGLADIRTSVRSLKADDTGTFSSKLNHLLEDIRSHTDLIVSSIIDLQSDLLPIQQHVLLQSLRECATNSLKHGNSTECDLLIQEHKNRIQLTFSDNGTGSDNLSAGFGLKNMEERVRSIGGTLAVQSAQGEGCTVSITLPVGLQKEGMSE